LPSVIVILIMTVLSTGWPPAQDSPAMRTTSPRLTLFGRCATGSAHGSASNRSANGTHRFPSRPGPTLTCPRLLDTTVSRRGLDAVENVAHQHGTVPDQAGPLMGGRAVPCTVDSWHGYDCQTWPPVCRLWPSLLTAQGGSTQVSPTCVGVRHRMHLAIRRFLRRS